METAASLLKEIGKSIDDEVRPAYVIYADIKNIVAAMMMTRKMTKDQCVFICAGLCKIFLMREQ